MSLKGVYGMRMQLFDVGYVIKVDEVKDGYLYVVDGKNSVYRIFSKKVYYVDTFVFVYTDGERLFLSDR